MEAQIDFKSAFFRDLSTVNESALGLGKNRRETGESVINGARPAKKRLLPAESRKA